jgi:hypothetical protein
MLAVCVRLRAAATALAAEQDQRSRLPATRTLLLRHRHSPPRSSHAPAQVPGKPPCGFSGSLKHAGVVAEITGRQSFQAFGIMCGLAWSLPAFDRRGCA